MKTVKLGRILENAARLAGRQVDVIGLPAAWAPLAAMAIDAGIRRLAAEKVPALERIELRQYRPEWVSNTGWQRGQECYHDGEYYRLDVATPVGAPSADGSGWKLLRMDEVAAFVAFDQPWEPVEIDPLGVDRNRFAYREDPRYFPSATPLSVTGLNELGVVLQAPAPRQVYVRFTPRFPNISFEAWSDETDYEAGDVVYLSGTKDCYQALTDVEHDGDSPDEDATHWVPVRVPAAFESYLTRLVASDLLTEDQGKYQTRAAADREFEELCDRLYEGMGESRIRTGRFV
ncbi:MAG: hypothetical protein IKF72_14495 [Kiritimatiellae bacterium]|nr:hypothetical protein [Kiritimatiellia bacterium]